MLFLIFINCFTFSPSHWRNKKKTQPDIDSKLSFKKIKIILLSTFNDHIRCDSGAVCLPMNVLEFRKLNFGLDNLVSCLRKLLVTDIKIKIYDLKNRLNWTASVSGLDRNKSQTL